MENGENKDQNYEYDFYSYGLRIAKDMYSNNKKLAQEIGEKYGEDAKLEFECGFSIGANRQSFVDIEEYTVNQLKNGKVLHSSLDTDDNSRNNSYFDINGTSKKYDIDGRYIPPAGTTKQENEQGTFTSAHKTR